MAHYCIGNPCILCTPRDITAMDKYQERHYYDLLEDAKLEEKRRRKDWSIFPVGVLF